MQKNTKKSSILSYLLPAVSLFLLSLFLVSNSTKSNLKNKKILQMEKYPKVTEANYNDYLYTQEYPCQSKDCLEPYLQPETYVVEGESLKEYVTFNLSSTSENDVSISWNFSKEAYTRLGNIYIYKWGRIPPETNSIIGYSKRVILKRQAAKIVDVAGENTFYRFCFTLINSQELYCSETKSVFNNNLQTIDLYLP